MNINELLDLMEETLEDGMLLPLGGGKRMVDTDKIRDIIGDIRDSLPNELEQARNIVADRTKILGDAKDEAEKTIKDAEEKARAMVEETEIVKSAKQRANEIAADANGKARNLLVNVVGHCDKVLDDTERRLTKYIDDIKAMRSALHRNDKKK